MSLEKKAKVSVLEDLIEMMKEKEAEEFKGRFASRDQDVEHIKEMKSMGESGPERFFEDPEVRHKEMQDKPQDDEYDLERLKELYSKLK